MADMEFGIVEMKLDLTPTLLAVRVVALLAKLAFEEIELDLVSPEGTILVVDDLTGRLYKSNFLLMQTSL